MRTIANSFISLLLMIMATGAALLIVRPVAALNEPLAERAWSEMFVREHFISFRFAPIATHARPPVRFNLPPEMRCPLNQQREIDTRAVLAFIQPDLSDEKISALARVLTREGRLYGFDPLLALAIIQVESNFRPHALSAKGARGIMQVMPPVGKQLARALGIRWHGGNTLDSPEANIRMGLMYLRWLNDRLGDRNLAIIAYNRGPNRLINELEDGHTEVSYLQRVVKAYVTLSVANAEVESLAEAEPSS